MSFLAIVHEAISTNFLFDENCYWQYHKPIILYGQLDKTAFNEVQANQADS